MDLAVSFKAAVLEDLIRDIFLGLDFLVEHQSSDCIIHLGKEKQVFVSWRNPETKVTEEVNLMNAKLP